MSENETPNPEVQEEEGDKKTFAEEVNVAGNQLVKEVERLIAEGNVRRLIIKQDDKVLLEVSLTLGVAAAGAVAIFAPWSAVILAAVAALAAAVARVTIVIERTEEGEETDMEDPHEE